MDQPPPFSVRADVNFDELARCSDLQRRAAEGRVCGGRYACAGREGTEITRDFIEGIAQVQAKKKTSLNYYA